MTTAETRRSNRARQKVDRYGVEGYEHSSDEEQTVRPKTVKKRTKKTNVVQPVEIAMQNHLFDVLMDPEVSLSNAAAEWIESYEATPTAALTDLVNLVLKCAGCELPIANHDTEDFDSANETIAQVQDMARQHIPAEYPIISRAKEMKNFGRQMTAFFDEIVVNAEARGVLYRSGDFVERVNGWIVVISAAHLRAFRHTATAILLSMMYQFCQCQKKQNEIKTKQQGIVDRASSRNKATLNRAKEALEDAKSKVEKLELITSDLFTSVFANRFHDVDDRIRADCVRTLGMLVEDYPEKFMANNYLKYFVSAIGDPAAPVRQEVLKELKKIYNRLELFASFKRFTDRFQNRFVDIALSDLDNGVRRAAIDLLSVLASNQLLSEANFERVVQLVQDSEPHVRKEAARLLTTKVCEAEVAEFEGISTQELDKMSMELSEQTKAPYLEFRQIAREIIKYAKDVVEHEPLKPTQIIYSLIRGREEYPSQIALIAEAMFGASQKIASEKWLWKDLALQLRYDFSALASHEKQFPKIKQYLSAFELSEEEKMVLLDVLYGFVLKSLDIAGAKRKGPKMRSQSDIDAAIADIQVGLISEVPMLLETFRYSPRMTAKVLKLATLIDPNFYFKSGKEDEQVEAFNQYLKQFLDSLDSDILAHCRTLFALNLAPTSSFEETAQQLLSNALNDMTYDVKQKLANSDSVDKLAVVPSLTRVQQLSTVINVSSFVEQEVEGDRNLGDILTAVLGAPTPQDAKVFELLTVEILKNYAIWKLGSFVRDDSAGAPGRSIQQDIDQLQTIVSQFETISRVPELPKSLKARKEGIRKYDTPLNTTIKIGLIEIITTIKIAKSDSNLSDHGSEVLESLPDTFSDRTEKEILVLFLAKESKYAEVVSKELDEAVLDDALLTLGDDIDEFDESNYDDLDGEPTEQEEAEMNPIALDTEICYYAAKINLAALCKLIRPDYESRLEFNLSALSARYARVMAATAKQETKKRKRGGEAHDSDVNMEL
ncbi:hypothetical protein TRVA0_006S03290 [Trichomonascus vanleenenianus]|uniref:cohesin subunit IRR1 n=1 Tax=Trichomonascus vanleenenianus TaxID=2268995 RepID=UPI003ECAD1D3